MVCHPTPRPLMPKFAAWASISLRSSITICGRNGRPYCLPRLMVETSPEAGRTKAGSATRPVTNSRLFTLSSHVEACLFSVLDRGYVTFVHVGSLKSEQPRRIVGEDALSHPAVGRPFT